MKNILVINAHQYYKGSEGKLNATMVSEITEAMNSKGYTVKHTAIEKGYEIDEEVIKHHWADIIITQSPVYWFGMPWIYKKYIDEVLSAGVVQKLLCKNDGRSRQDPNKQYGTGGKMQGKKFMISLTWNAPEEAFDNEDQFLFNGKSVDDIFINITAAYKFCGAEILPSFSCFNIMKAPDIEGDIERLKRHLAKHT